MRSINEPSLEPLQISAVVAPIPNPQPLGIHRDLLDTPYALQQAASAGEPKTINRMHLAHALRQRL